MGFHSVSGMKSLLTADGHSRDPERVAAPYRRHYHMIGDDDVSRGPCCGWCSPLATPFWTAVFFFVVSLTVNCLVQAADYARRFKSPETIKLPDIGHDFLPHIKSALYHELAVYLASGLVIIAAIVPHSRRMTLLRQLFLVWGATLLLRSYLIPWTSYPDPSDGCQGSDPIPGSPYAASFSGVSCGDLMFSGHTSLAFHVVLVLLEAYPLRCQGGSVLLHVISVIIFISAALAIVITHLHYSADVWVAIGTTVGCWFFYQTISSSDRARRGFGGWIKWCERDRLYHMPCPGCDKAECCWTQPTEVYTDCLPPPLSVVIDDNSGL